MFDKKGNKNLRTLSKSEASKITGGGPLFEGIAWLIGYIETAPIKSGYPNSLMGGVTYSL